MVERITTTSVLFPFPRSLIDNHVLISTPPTGILKALRQLAPLQKAQLENALSTSARLVAPDGLRSSGVPSFYWQISENDLPQLLQENAWLTGVPFAVVQPGKPGISQLILPRHPSPTFLADAGTWSPNATPSRATAEGFHSMQ